MGARAVTFTALRAVPLIEPGDDLCAVIVAALRTADIMARDGDILVVAQKIVSKAEGRYVDLAAVTPSPRAREIGAAARKDARIVEVILSESAELLRQRGELLIVVHRLGFVMANAGIDQSNIAQPDGAERVLLLPDDPDQTCATLKDDLDRALGANLGIVMNDSFGRAWRNGIVGVALGAAGVPSLRNMIGQPDLFGRAMQVTEVAIADELAAAASLLMGQAAEATPVIHVRGLSWDAPITNAAALIRPKHMDLFR